MQETVRFGRRAQNEKDNTTKNRGNEREQEPREGSQGCGEVTFFNTHAQHWSPRQEKLQRFAQKRQAKNGTSTVGGGAASEPAEEDTTSCNNLGMLYTTVASMLLDARQFQEILARTEYSCRGSPRAAVAGAAQGNAADSATDRIRVNWVQRRSIPMSRCEETHLGEPFLRRAFRDPTLLLSRGAPLSTGGTCSYPRPRAKASLGRNSASCPGIGVKWPVCPLW